MSIINFFKKSKSIVNENNDALIITLIIVTTFGGFGLGRLSISWNNKEIVRINQQVSPSAVSFSEDNKKIFNIGGYYIASKNGTKYHFPWCSGAQRIKQTNKIVFNTVKEAERAGYFPASNCKGL